MMSAVNNSIHGNIASTGAKVNNIVQHIGTQNFSWNPRVLLETFARTNVIDHVLAPEGTLRNMDLAWPSSRLAITEADN